MLGLFGTLNLGTRALQTQQQGVELAGQNLANVNNPAYARQRLALQTSLAIPTSVGPQGTGVEAIAIRQIRDTLLDQQIQSETSVTGFLQGQQTALQYVQANLGEQLGGSAASSSASGAGGVGSTGGLASELAGLFNAFQDLSTAPASVTSRQAVIAGAQQLAAQFNQVDGKLTALKGMLNESVQTDVASANELLSDIAGLNQQIANAEVSGGTANDLRDLRQQKLEQLAGLVNFQAVRGANGAVNISIDGNLLVSEGNVQDTLQAYDAGSGALLVRTAASGTNLTLTGGAIQGAIDARDTALKSLQDGLNTLASQLITRVNAVYSGGYDLNGNTGAAFFSGTNAADIALNASLAANPSSLQAAGMAGAPGDNAVALALAQLANARQPGLGNLTFAENYNATVTNLGRALSAVNSDLAQQQAIQNALQTQRSTISGVSIDEEMTDIIKYQRAFQASAHIVSTVDQMLEEIVNLKR